MRRFVVLAAATISLLGACGREDPTGATVFGILPATADTIAGSGSLAELRLMKARWTEARRGRNYSFVTGIGCFCPAYYGASVRVVVFGDRVATVREIDSGGVRPARDYYTIEELFDRAIAFRADGGPVRATYDGRAGFPLWLTIGTPENDGGVVYAVRDVEFAR